MKFNFTFNRFRRIGLNTSLFLTLLLSLTFVACSDDGDNDPPVNPNADLYGKWVLTELMLPVAQDLDKDGNASENIVDELSCFFAEHELKDDFSFTSRSMGFSIQQISATEVEMSCTNEMNGAGSWERISPTVIELDGTEFTLQGNRMFLERPVGGLPEIYRIVYEKR